MHRGLDRRRCIHRMQIGSSVPRGGAVEERCRGLRGGRISQLGSDGVSSSASSWAVTCLSSSSVHCRSPYSSRARSLIIAQVKQGASRATRRPPRRPSGSAGGVACRGGGAYWPARNPPVSSAGGTIQPASPGLAPHSGSQKADLRQLRSRASHFAWSSDSSPKLTPSRPCENPT